VGIGMNEMELARNPSLTEHRTIDLNAEGGPGQLAFLGDGTVDAVLCAVSADYLVRPREVFEQALRALKPGGSVLLLQSNRCFPTKTMALWNSTNDAGRCWILATYLHASGFEGVRAERLETGGRDPLFLVHGTKGGARRAEL
jgi:SAM-dependent methyltransferase